MKGPCLECCQTLASQCRPRWSGAVAIGIPPSPSRKRAAAEAGPCLQAMSRTNGDKIKQLYLVKNPNSTP